MTQKELKSLKFGDCVYLIQSRTITSIEIRCFYSSKIWHFNNETQMLNYARPNEFLEMAYLTEQEALLEKIKMLRTNRVLKIGDAGIDGELLNNLENKYNSIYPELFI